VSGSEAIGGLVGYNSGTIVSCHTTADIETTNSSADSHGGGGLAGVNVGVLADSSADAEVVGSGLLGGLTGSNFGVIWRCFARGEVAGGDRLGGLVGSAVEGTISNCYSVATVSGTYGIYTGGLIGYYAGDVLMDCYAAGAVYNGDIDEQWDWGGLIGSSGGRAPTINHCFWDIESSLSTVSDGGKGLTTSEMQTRDTFTQAGWRFHTTWMICEGQDYPRLQWEGIDCDR
jgi:hypothetical protein